MEKITVVYRNDDSDESENQDAEGEEKSKEKRKDLKEFMLEKFEDIEPLIKRKLVATDKKINRLEEMIKNQSHNVKTPEQK